MTRSLTFVQILRPYCPVSPSAVRRLYEAHANPASRSELAKALVELGQDVPEYLKETL